MSLSKQYIFYIFIDIILKILHAYLFVYIVYAYNKAVEYTSLYINILTFVQYVAYSC